MTNDNDEFEDSQPVDENNDMTPEHAAVAALTQALLVTWNDLEEGLAEVEESPLVKTMYNALQLFTDSHPVLVSNDVEADVMQFGAELHAFGEVASKLHELMDSPEFATAQWGAVYAHVEESKGIPSAVCDAFRLGYNFEDGFEIVGIKPMFDDDENLIVEQWGAAHQLAAKGLYDPAHLEHLPRPAEEFFFDKENLE